MKPRYYHGGPLDGQVSDQHRINQISGTMGEIESDYTQLNVGGSFYVDFHGKRYKLTTLYVHYDILRNALKAIVEYK